MTTDSRDVLTRLPSVLPDELAARVDGWSAGRATTVPQAAASVALLRDGPAGLQTYLLHRHARMPFAASMVVFPGGRVDPADGLAPGADIAPGPSTELGPDPGSVWLSCAVRETAEETGVRLDRGTLVRWAHWVTPEFEPRRYDTMFYLAALPAGQVARDISGETNRAEWARPSEALAAADAGDLALMPPTRSILLELRDLGSVAEALAAGIDRQIGAVLPRVERVHGRWHFCYPSRGSVELTIPSETQFAPPARGDSLGVAPTEGSVP